MGWDEKVAVRIDTTYNRGQLSRREALLKCHLAFFYPISPSFHTSTRFPRDWNKPSNANRTRFYYQRVYVRVALCSIWYAKIPFFTMEERLLVSDRVFCVLFVITGSRLYDIYDDDCGKHFIICREKKSQTYIFFRDFFSFFPIEVDGSAKSKIFREITKKFSNEKTPNL